MLSQCLARPLASVRDCVQEVLFDCCASYVSMLCKSGWLAVTLNGSLWVECLTRCEHGGLAVTFLVLLAVSRVSSDFGRPLAVGVYMAESI